MLNNCCYISPVNSYITKAQRIFVDFLLAERLCQIFVTTIVNGKLQMVPLDNNTKKV